MAAVIHHRNICFHKSNFSLFLKLFYGILTFMTSKNNDFVLAGEKFFVSGKADPFGSTCYNYDPIHKKYPFLNTLFIL